MFNKEDSLAQMPWGYWANNLVRAIKNRDNRFRVYRGYQCYDNELMTNTQSNESVLVDEEIYDTLGHKSSMALGGTVFKGVEIAEKWSFRYQYS